MDYEGDREEGNWWKVFVLFTAAAMM